MIVLAALLAAAVASPPSLDDCDARVRDHPEAIESYLCYWLAARKLNALEDAARRLDARLALHPDDHLAELYLGLIEGDLHHERALSLFERAAEGLAAGKNRTGEVYARISVAYVHRASGRREAAAAALAQARKAAEASGDPLLLARMDWEDARQAFAVAEYGTSWALASKAQAAITDKATLDLRSGVLASLGAAAWALGRHRDSFDLFRRQAELLHAAGETWVECQARSNMAVLAGELLAEGDMSIDDVRKLIRSAFDAAVAAKNPWVEADVRALLAEDPGLPLSERLEHSRIMLARAARPERVGKALRSLAVLTLENDPAHPEAALALVERAEKVARESGSPLDVALAAVARSDVRWKIGPRDQAIADTLAELDAFERIRNLQRDDIARARWFASQAIHYDRAVGRILESEPGGPSRASLDLAFSIVERMRARALLDSLDAQRVPLPAAVPGDPAEVERNEVIERITAAQRRLVEGKVVPEELAPLLDEIERLEGREGILADEIARKNSGFEATKRPRIPSLEEVQALLAPDEAILAYQLSTRRVDDAHRTSLGGSWVFVVTRDDARALPLPDADLLAKSIDIYLGTFERRDGLDREASARLYEDVVAGAVRFLPGSVRRLVVVPDRDLHRLPFHALAPGAGAPPLAAAYELSIVPSATIWARSRREGAPAPATQALALADPALPGATERSASLRQAAPWVEGLRLGPLPNARREARRLAQLLAGHCRFLEGAAASESGLKAAALDETGLLVFATHAVVDEERPERSAILLAPGADRDDGVLQPREIARLPLGGKLVVLSSCSSATGALLQGEGVLGLARAFFRGGARAVVASLWPMRDDETADIAGAFYRHLSRGESAGSALASARRDRMAAGAPAAEWAGLVLLGDASLVPFPGGVAAAPAPKAVPVVPLTIAVAVAAVVALLFRFRGEIGGVARPSR